MRIVTLPLFLLSGLAMANPQALLISPPELKEAWDGYAKLRGEAGTPMKVVTTDEIAKTYKEGDLANKIRLCVREHIDKHGFKSVILGGDSTPEGGLIPDRDTFHLNMWGNDKDIPSDIYFLSPTSWDHDKDGIYGEFKEDREAITYPDGKIGLGRIPVRTPEDVAAYGKKVTAYLASIAEDKPSGELSFNCAVQGAYAKVYRSGAELVTQAWPEGQISFFFNDVTSWDGEKRGGFDLSPTNLIAKINEGTVNKWHFHGHGLIDRWVLEHEESFSFQQIEKLTNATRPAVITTVSCFTGQFDGKQDPSISEAMLRHAQGGAVAIVAPAREGKPHFHDPQKDFPLMMRAGKLDGTTQTMASFWVAALGKKLTMGEALMHAKADLADDAQKSATYHQGICELNLLGDPTLPVK